MNKSEIKRELQKMGISPALLGYHYLTESIYRVSERLAKPKIKIKITDVYAQVAEQFGSTSSRVERAMRHSIERAFDHGSEELEERFYYLNDYDKGKVTNSCFIFMIVDHLREVQNNER